jgi:hypothetical protein
MNQLPIRSGNFLTHIQVYETVLIEQDCNNIKRVLYLNKGSTLLVIYNSLV